MKTMTREKIIKVASEYVKELIEEKYISGMDDEIDTHEAHIDWFEDQKNETGWSIKFRFRIVGTCEYHPGSYGLWIEPWTDLDVDAYALDGTLYDEEGEMVGKLDNTELSIFNYKFKD